MIQIFTTGGTIEGIDLPNSDSIDRTKRSIEDHFIDANVDFDYSIECICDKDSRLLNKGDRQKLLDKILRTKTSKILITHGTFTMQNTAEFLGTKQLQKTIVLVGSFVLGNHINSDAAFNLGFALSAVQFLPLNVYVAMHGKVFIWNNVSKNIAANKFESNE